MADGDNIDDVFLAINKQMRSNRQGNLFLQVELQDRSGSLIARMWNASEGVQKMFDDGGFIHARGRVQLYQGALQIILSSISPVESEKIDLADFLPHTEQDIAKLLERLRGSVRKMTNHHLRGLVECFLMDEEFMAGFTKAPAGIRNHHAYLGGLLEHVVNLLDGAERILPLYTDLNRDLLLTGIFLHDIGKVRELNYTRSFGYSDEGQLIGHLVIGVEMLNEKLAEVKKLTGERFPYELELRLKHMIVSHHGTYEFGSPKLPMTPEAIALHHLDNLDAKVHTFTRDIREDQNQASAWTPFNQSLQRRLFKGSANGEALYSPTLEPVD
jgi:3'-5' exoribonuclease